MEFTSKGMFISKKEIMERLPILSGMYQCFGQNSVIDWLMPQIEEQKETDVEKQK